MPEIDQIIQFRKSYFVKEFNGNTLSDELVTRMLQNAATAPNHKLTKPWRFAIFEGESKNILCEKMEQYYLAFTPSEKFRQDKLDKIRTYKTKVSHIISIGMHPSGLVPEWEELAATAMAVQNMYLTLAVEPHAAGYWTSGNGTGSDFMKEATGLAPEDKQLGFFFLGYVENKNREIL